MEATEKIETIERGKFIGPMSDHKSLLDRLYRDGWHVTQSGPYTNRKMWPTVDVERYMIVAERELDWEQFAK